MQLLIFFRPITVQCAKYGQYCPQLSPTVIKSKTKMYVFIGCAAEIVNIYVMYIGKVDIVVIIAFTIFILCIFTLWKQYDEDILCSLSREPWLLLSGGRCSAFSKAPLTPTTLQLLKIFIFTVKTTTALNMLQKQKRRERWDPGWVVLAASAYL